jgi:hypothetical protein
LQLLLLSFQTTFQLQPGSQESSLAVLLPVNRE